MLVALPPVRSGFVRVRGVGHAVRLTALLWGFSTGRSWLSGGRRRGTTRYPGDGYPPRAHHGLRPRCVAQFVWPQKKKYLCTFFWPSSRSRSLSVFGFPVGRLDSPMEILRFPYDRFPNRVWSFPIRFCLSQSGSSSLPRWRGADLWGVQQ